MKPILVTCFKNPDLDGFSCAYAYAELLNALKTRAFATIFGRIHKEVEFILARYGIARPKEANLGDFDEIILVDSAIVNALPEDLDIDKVIELIDHRKLNDSAKFKNAKVQIELVGAAATLIAEKFYDKKIKPTKEAAILLYGAIVSNTLNFKSGTTTERDQKMAEFLAPIVQPDKNFAKEMFRAKSDLADHTLKEILENDYFSYNIFGKEIGITQLEIVEGKKLADEREDEILSELEYLNEKYKADFSFCSIISLDENCNIFIAEDKRSLKLLEKMLNLKFKDHLSIRPGFIMRKEFGHLWPKYEKFIKAL